MIVGIKKCANCIIICLLIILAIFYVQTQLKEISYKFMLQNVNVDEEEGITNNNASMPPIILGWNNYYYFGNVVKMLTDVNSVKECPFQCQYESDRKFAPHASAIIFHINSKANGLPSPEQRSKKQLYAFFIDEIPQAHLKPPRDFENVSADFFNITITFRTDSTIFYPYDAFEEFVPGLDGEEEKWAWEEVVQKVEGKRKLALAVRSNCYTASKRENYLQALKKHMTVKEFGECPGVHCDYACYRNQLETHLFFLAFENTICEQYVSEKFWNLKKLIVPVVLSRTVFANITDIPADCFIAADDFSGPRELAEYLIKLSKDRNLYLRYFEWTKKYKKTSFHQILRPLHYYHQAIVPAKSLSPHNPMCNLCKLLHLANQTTMRRTNITQFWDPTKNCVANFADKLLSPF